MASLVMFLLILLVMMVVVSDIRISGDYSESSGVPLSVMFRCLS